ncbi:MAG: preprotein translocase subunit SecE [Aestuariivirgaceae bacterium]|nr:preprotein translocase subunit SecE [Aestuariivirgaceae bacterium]
MAKSNPFQYLKDVRQEASKVSWPSRRETLITTMMVLIMVAISSIFFLGVDAVIKYLVDGVLLRVI